MSEEMTFRCPNCGSQLLYGPGDKSVVCYVCDSTVNVPGVAVSGAGNNTFIGMTGVNSSYVDASAAVAPAFVGFDNPESGVVYVENFFDTYNWEDYQKGVGISIPEIKKVIDNNKMKNGALALSWYLDFIGMATPLRKKMEGLGKLQEEIGAAYNPVDASSACAAFDTYARIVKRLTEEKESIFKQLETSVAYAKKFALEAAKLKEMNAELTALGKLFDEKVVKYEKLSDVPAYQAAKKEASKAVAAKLQEKGVNAEEMYKKALAQYNSTNADKSAALGMFEMIRGYEDSIEYIEKINQYFVADNTLYRFFGKHYIYKVENYSATLNMGSLKKKAKNNGEGDGDEEQQSSSALSLYEIVDGLPAEEPLIRGIDQIVGCYGSRLYYFKLNQGIYSYDVYTKMEECINKGKTGDYINAEGKYEYSFTSKGDAFFVRKKLSAEEIASGCMKKNKAPEAKLNQYCVILVDMGKNTCRTLVKEVFTLAKHYEDKIFYTYAYKPEVAKSGCFKSLFKKPVVPETKTKLLICDIVTGQSKEILDEDCEIHAVSGNNIVYSIWKPNQYNKDLHVCNFETGEDTIIECNIYKYFDIIAGKLYYTVGNESFRPLVRCDFDGANREEIMANVENIVGDRGGWLYVKKGKGRNAALVKVSGDGKTRQLLCTQFKMLCRFVDNQVYYVDIYNSLRVVRIDGKENRELAKDVTNVFHTENGLYYVREEQVNEKETALSLYWMDHEGRNVKKIVFNIDYVKIDDATNSLYYSKEEYIRFKVYLPKKEKEAMYQMYNINKFYALDRETNKSKLVLTLGIPNESKQGCLKKNTKKYIYEEAPIKQSYTAHSIVVEEKEEGVITPVETPKKTVGCGCLKVPALPAGGKNVNPTKASATSQTKKRAKAARRSNLPKPNPITTLLFLVALGMFAWAISLLISNIDLYRAEPINGIMPIIVAVIAGGTLALALLKGKGKLKASTMGIAALAIVIALVGCIIGFTKVPGKGDTKAEAITLSVDDSEDVKLKDGAKQYYKFIATEDGEYTISLTDSNSNDAVYVVIEEDSYYNQTTKTFTYMGGEHDETIQLKSYKTYYITFYSYSSSTIKFDVEIDKAESGEPGSGNSGTSASDAIAMTESTEYSGDVSYGNAVWYSYTPTTSGSYVITTESPYTMYLYYYGTNTSYYTNYYYGTANETTVTLSLYTTYYFKVAYYSTNTSYTIEINKYVEPGSSAEAAVEMTEDTSYSGNVSSSKTAVWYSFTPSESGKYVVTTSSVSDETYLYYYTNPNYSYSDSDYGYNNELTVTLDADTTYYFKVSYEWYSTSFTIEVDKKSAGLTASDAVQMDLDTEYSGDVSYGAPVWYKFTPTTSGTYVVTTNSPYTMYLYYYGTSTSYYSNYYYGTENETSLTLSSYTTYYFKVGYYSTNTSYTIEINKYVEPGSSAEAAVEMTEDTSYSGNVSSSKTAVWYSFTPSESGKYVVTSTSVSDETYLYYYTDPDYSDSLSDWGYNNEITVTLDADTTYYFKVSYDWYSTSFTIEVDKYIAGLTASDAVQMDLDTEYSGDVSSSKTAVWYSFTPTTSGSYAITTESPYTMYLYYYGTSTSYYSNYYYGMENEITLTLSSYTTYYFKVGYYSTDTSYTIEINVGPGSSADVAIEMAEDTSYSGSVSSSNTAVWYSFTPSESGDYVVTTSSSSDETYLYYYTDPDYSHSNSDWGYNNEITVTLEADTTYYFKVSYDWYSTSFTIEVDKYIAGLTASDAVQMDLDTPYDGTVSSSVTSIWYKYSPSESGRYTVTVSSDDWTYLYYYGTSTSSYANYDYGSDNEITVSLTSGYTYYFRVYYYYSYDVDYTIELEQVPGSSANAAIAMTEDTSYSGYVSSSATAVWYSFTPSESGDYVVTTSSSSYYTYLYYYTDPDYSYTNYKYGYNNEMTVTLEADTTYYFLVYYYSGSTSFTIEIGEKTYDGTSRDSAIPLESGTSYSGYLYSGDYVWYSFTPTYTSYYNINVSAWSSYVYLYYYGTSSSYSNYKYGYSPSLSSLYLYSGTTYYFKVSYYNGSTSFTVEVN